MVKTIEGVYENGIIKPLEPIRLKNASKVLITIVGAEAEPKESVLEFLTTNELLVLAQKRVEQLKASGISRSEVVNDMLALLDEIRDTAIEQGMAVDNSDE